MNRERATERAENTDGNPAEGTAPEELVDDLERRYGERTAELRQSRALLQAIVDNTPALIYVKDLRGRMTFANEALCKAVAGESVLGKRSGDFVADPRDAELHEVHDRKVVETGQALTAEESSSGKTFLSVKFPIRDARGQIYATGGISTDISAQKLTEAALQQSYERLTEQHRTLRHLLQSSDNERQVIAYEIHDGLAQQLTGAIMHLQAYEARRDACRENAADAYEAGMRLLQQACKETRRLISGLRPPVLDESGVIQAVAHLVHDMARQKGPQIEFRSMVTFNRLAPVLENAVYRICQEALTNAARHSQAKKVRLSLVQIEDRIRIEVRDWGVGFDTKAAERGRFGLEGIRQRARILGGKCKINSKPGEGSRIRVELPMLECEEDV
jgi:PAS domain S-box-containing protein